MGRYTPFQQRLPNGETIQVVADDHPSNPRTEFDQLGCMVCWHSRYDLGDKHRFDTPTDFEDAYRSIPHLRLPLFLFDHSGLTMRTTPFSCPWDSGQVGWIVLPHDRLRAEFGRKRLSTSLMEKGFNILRAEVAEYDQYLQGDVWVVDHLGSDGEFIDSLSGIFGKDYAVETAREWLANAQTAA